MSTHWDDYPEASLEGFERRCSRPGNRNHAALDALRNYRRELDSLREQAKLLKQSEEREERQMMLRDAATREV